MTAPRRTLAALVTLLALTGACSADPPAPTTLTLDQARTQGQDFTRGALAVLPPGASLEPSDESETVCKVDIPQLQPEGQIQVTRAYRVRGLPPTQNPTVVEALHRYTLAQGFQPYQDARPAQLDVFYRRAVDDFTASIQTDVRGVVDVGASSPCIWPDGRAPAER